MMIDHDNNVYFSIIIPTRNRPELFRLALNSVLSQDFAGFEIVVVNDGSTEEFLERYDTIKAEFSDTDKVKFFDLVHRPNGHGQSYSMNYGVSMAKGKYIGFLDDDDYWTDSQHLTRTFSSIAKSNQEVDAYYTNQEAYFSDGTKQNKNVWIEDLKTQLSDKIADEAGSYSVDVPFLLKSGGFAHLNCTIVRKKLYESIGGMDENIRYECDRDIYIRVIDAADVIFYNPSIISKHNIPDSKKKDNMSTLVATSEKLIYQLRVYDKGISLTKNSAIVEHCAIGKMYILKKLAEEFYSQNEIKRSALFSAQALGIKFSLKWCLFTMYLKIKSQFSQ